MNLWHSLIEHGTSYDTNNTSGSATTISVTNASGLVNLSVSATFICIGH